MTPPVGLPHTPSCPQHPPDHRLSTPGQPRTDPKRAHPPFRLNTLTHPPLSALTPVRSPSVRKYFLQGTVLQPCHSTCVFTRGLVVCSKEQALLLLVCRPLLYGVGRPLGAACSAHHKPHGGCVHCAVCHKPHREPHCVASNGLATLCSASTRVGDDAR